MIASSHVGKPVERNITRTQPRRSPLRWIGIVATIAFAGFIGTFSLDEPLLSVGFLMHNVPTLIVLVGAALAWWRAWAGAAWLAAAAIAAIAYFEPFRERVDWLLLIPGPPLLIAALLVLDAVRHRRLTLRRR